MKNYSTLPLLIISLLVIHAFPKKAERTDTHQIQLLTQHPWVKEKAEVVVPTHRAGADLSDACERDDRYVFEQGGGYYQKKGIVRCGSEEVSKITGTWQLLEDGTLRLSTGDNGLSTYVAAKLSELTVTRRVVELTGQRLRISVSVRQHGSEIMRILETYTAA